MFAADMPSTLVVLFWRIINLHVYLTPRTTKIYSPYLLDISIPLPLVCGPNIRVIMERRLALPDTEKGVAFEHTSRA